MQIDSPPRADLQLRAWTRLAALVTFGLILGALACRPTWTSDGSKVVYPAKDGTRTVLAECEIETGATRVLRPIEPADGAGVAVWDRKGAQWVLVEAHSVEDNAIVAITLDAKSEVRKQHTVEVGVRNVSALAAEPVVLDGSLFLAGKRALRIDLETGETKEGPAPKPNLQAPVLFRYGDGLGYASAGRAGGRWEIGKLDPETLASEPVFSRPGDCGWDIVPHPQFNAGLDRCAVVGFQGDPRGDAEERRWAILVLSEGKVESTLELGTGLVAGPLRWGPDRVTIYATLVRLGDEHDTFALYETDFSGSVTRETALVRNPIDERQRGAGGAMVARAMPFAMQPSVSPDGHHVAFTTALLPKLPAAEHGLLLIDTQGRARTVQRVPFPTSKR